MVEVMNPSIIRLRRLNIYAGALHLVSFLTILWLSNDVSLPVRATYLSEAPGTGNFADPVELFSLNISWMVAAFMALSAFFSLSRRITGWVHKIRCWAHQEHQRVSLGGIFAVLFNHDRAHFAAQRGG